MSARLSYSDSNDSNENNARFPDIFFFSFERSLRCNGKRTSWCDQEQFNDL